MATPQVALQRQLPANDNRESVELVEQRGPFPDRAVA